MLKKVVTNGIWVILWKFMTFNFDHFESYFLLQKCVKLIICNRKSFVKEKFSNCYSLYKF